MVGQLRVKNSDRLSKRRRLLVVCEGIKAFPRRQILKQRFTLVLQNSCKLSSQENICDVDLFLNVENRSSYKVFPCECFEQLFHRFRNSRPAVFSKKGVLKNSQNSQENTCARVFLVITFETLAQVFSCQFCEIFKDIFFIEHVLWLLSQVATANYGLKQRDCKNL